LVILPALPKPKNAGAGGDHQYSGNANKPGSILNAKPFIISICDYPQRIFDEYRAHYGQHGGGDYLHINGVSGYRLQEQGDNHQQDQPAKRKHREFRGEAIMGLGEGMDLLFAGGGTVAQLFSGEFAIVI